MVDRLLARVRASNDRSPEPREATAHSFFSGHAKLLCLLVLLALSPPPTLLAAHSQDSDSEEVAENPAQVFVSERNRIGRLIGRRNWQSAEVSILQLLREHAGADYARPFLSGLRDDLRRARFWRTTKEPRRDELVSGDLVQYRVPDGRIKIRYTHEDLEDFLVSGGTYVHPMHFNRTWTVLIEGEAKDLVNCQYFLELGEPGRYGARSGYIISLGMRVKGATNYRPHIAARVSSSADIIEDVKPREIKTPNKKTKAKITVTDRKIKLTYGGKPVFEIDRDSREMGRFGLIPNEPLGHFGRLTIDGTIDRGWFDGLLDEAVSEKRDAFDASWENPEEFASWPGFGVPMEPETTWAELLQNVEFKVSAKTEELLAAYEKVVALLGKRRSVSMMVWSQLKESPPEAWTDSAINFTKFSAAMDLGYFTDAYYFMTQLEPIEGMEEDAELLRAEILRLTGRLPETLERYQVLAEKYPDKSLVHERHASTLLLLNRPEEAHAAVLAGLKRLPASPRLRELELMVVKADQGPAWESKYENIGTDFVAYTNVDKKTAKEAREVLDEAWQKCKAFFHMLEVTTQPLGIGSKRNAECHSVAYIFSGESSYARYVEGVADGSSENTLGVYNPMLQHIAAWNQPRKTDLWRTLRHEVAHRYLHLALGDRFPRWVNEGLAETFASCWDEDGKFGKPNDIPHHLGLLTNAAALPNPSTLVVSTDSQFMANSDLNYAYSWALLRFMGSTKRQPESPVRWLLDRLQSEDDPRRIMDELRERVDLAEIQKQIRRWIRSAEVDAIFERFGGRR